MPPILRISLVIVVLGAGVGGAMLFRKQAPAPGARDLPAGGLLLRSDAPRVIAGPTQVDQPPGRQLDDDWARRFDPADDPRWSNRPASSGEPPLAPPTLAPLSPLLADRSPSAPAAETALVPSGDVPRPSPARPVRTHRIADGDTLAALAERYLGDRNRWFELYELNRDVLAHPQILPLGALLRIDSLEAEPGDGQSRPRLRPL